MSAPRQLGILVVDDEPLIRWVLRRALTARGHEVAEAGDAAQALGLLRAASSRFDVVLLDYRLPDRQDLTLLQQVHQAAPGTAVLMMTAYGEEAMRAQALTIGARAVVDKPFQVAEVVSLVEAQAP